jgi:hypothetical protein
MDLNEHAKEIAARIEHDEELLRDYKEDPVRTIESITNRQQISEEDFVSFVDSVNDRVHDSIDSFSVGFAAGVYPMDTTM